MPTLLPDGTGKDCEAFQGKAVLSSSVVYGLGSSGVWSGFQIGAKT